MSAVRVAGVLLAAGASRRLGQPKQLLPDATGTPAVVRFARALHAAGCSPVCVVVGAHADDVCRVLANEPVQIVHHAHWADGMGTSIAAGVAAVQARPGTAAADEAAGEGILICPCDMPAVSVSHLRALVQQFDGHARVASAYTRTAAGADNDAPVHGIPAILPRRDWPWLAALTGDAGARPLLRDDDVRVVPLAAGALDIDTPADLARWQGQRAT